MFKKLILLAFSLVCAINLHSQKFVPNIPIETFKGTYTTMSKELSDDSYYILSFWATWCVPCINELDALNEVYDCLLYTSPSPRDPKTSRMPSSA